MLCMLSYNFYHFLQLPILYFLPFLTYPSRFRRFQSFASKHGKSHIKITFVLEAEKTQQNTISQVYLDNTSKLSMYQKCCSNVRCSQLTFALALQPSACGTRPIGGCWESLMNFFLTRFSLSAWYLFLFIYNHYW